MNSRQCLSALVDRRVGRGRAAGTPGTRSACPSVQAPTATLTSARSVARARLHLLQRAAVFDRHHLDEARRDDVPSRRGSPGRAGCRCSRAWRSISRRSSCDVALASGCARYRRAMRLEVAAAMLERLERSSSPAIGSSSTIAGVAARGEIAAFVEHDRRRRRSCRRRNCCRSRPARRRCRRSCIRSHARPTPSTTATAPELRTAKRSPATPLK